MAANSAGHVSGTDRATDMARMGGRILAHEVGHSILGGDEMHKDNTLMQGTPSYAAFVDRKAGFFRFDPQQLDAIHSWLVTGARVR